MISRAVLVHYRTEEAKAISQNCMAIGEGVNTAISITVPANGRGVIR